MAATAGRFTNGASGVNANGDHTNEGFWSYAVPSQNENTFDEDKPTTSSDYSNYQDYRPPLAQSHNAAPKPRTQHSMKSKTSLELSQPVQNTLRPPSNEQADVSGGSSENDSLLDLYNTSNDRWRAGSRDRHKVKRKGSRGATTVLEETPEEAESKWIHRDKLAQIESRELAEMGVRVSRPSRASSKKSVKTSKSSVDAGDIGQDEQMLDDYPLPDGKRQRQLGPSDELQDDASPSESFENHRQQRSQDSISIPRPGTSRIPVSTAPLSTSAHSENDESPLGQSVRRKRSTSGSAYQHARSRSRSGGSQHLLNLHTDQDRSPGTPPSSQTSPNGFNSSSPRGKLPSKETPQSRARANSNTRKTSAQSRNASGPNSANRESPKRPGTSSGASRPATARPEGEAPWIATMFKPDPRLPPEQQMLPTHAKKMAQMHQQSEPDQNGQNGDLTLLPDSDASGGEGEKRDRSQMQPEGRSQSMRKRDSGQGSDWQRQYRQNQMADRRESGQWPLRTPSGHSAYPEYPTRSQSLKRNNDSYESQYQSGSSPPPPPPPPPPPQNQIKTEPEIWVSGKNSIVGVGEHAGFGLMPNTTANGNASPNARGETQPQQQQQQQRRASARLSQRSRMEERERELEESAVHAPVNQPVRLHEDKEEKEDVKKKKGCMSCCVVM